MADAVSLDRVPIPLPRTRLFGRDPQIACGRTHLLDRATPLLTLTGPGGVGKTRLALAIAADTSGRFADGVAWVDLAPARDPALVPTLVANALGITLPPGGSATTELCRLLRPMQLLLLIDNCEHVLDATAELVASVLASCPAVQVLATSRAPLHIHGEQVLPVEPLPQPLADTPSLAAVEQNDAVRLFVERARAVRPAFFLSEGNAATVAAISRALDGLPLAIELAAARITILSPAALLAHMTHRLSLLSDGPRDAPSRQRTLDATIAWSYDLLSEDEQALFRRLAVFSGGFTLDAAQAVANWRGSHHDFVRGLDTLIDQSLVYRLERDGAPRYTMLETLREFGLTRMQERGEESIIRDRHSTFFLEWVTSLQAWALPHLPETPQVLDHLESEFPNLRAALDWQQATGDVPALLALASELSLFWQLRGHLGDGRARLEWGLAQEAGVPASVRADAQLALSRILEAQQDPVAAMALCIESLRYYRTTADAGRTARACEQAASISLDMSNPEETHAYIGEALATLATLNAPWARRAASDMRFYLGVLAKNQGNLPEAELILREVIAEQRRFARDSGEEHPNSCWPLLALGAVAHAKGELATALECYQASLDHAWRFRESACAAFNLSRAAGILAAAGRWQDAARLFGATESFCEELGFAFTGNVWHLTRAFGLPQPWGGEEDFTGQAAGVRAAVLAHSPRPLPPLPDPSAAAALWEAGRTIPIEHAVTQTIAVDLATPSAILLVAAISGGTPLRAADGLTPRQQEILNLLCQRYTDPEIAARLFISPRTVEGHVARIFARLGVDNRRDAAAAAVRLSLV